MSEKPVKHYLLRNHCEYKKVNYISKKDATELEREKSKVRIFPVTNRNLWDFFSCKSQVEDEEGATTSVWPSTT